MDVNRSEYRAVNTNNDLPVASSYRFVNKNGRINVTYTSIGRLKHIHSNFILFIMKTEWWLVVTFLLFGLAFSWFFFAFLYFLVSIEHGDFVLNEDDEDLANNQTDFTLKTTFIPKAMCVQNVHNFLSALLFSIETQHTIGYGSRYITTECMGGILILTLQCSLGYLLQVIVTQIVFTKISRPTEKSRIVVFSDNALIIPRDRQLTLNFRIGNLSVSQLIFASVRLLMIRERRTNEGEIIPHQIHDMQLTHLRNGQLFFPRPFVVEHVIDRFSPLYGIQRSALAQANFEIIAIIEGIFDYTGFSCHFRTSYLPNELLWGYEFSSCDSTLEGFDYSQFNRSKLVYARPLWNYEDERSVESTAANSPTSPHYSHNHPVFFPNSNFNNQSHRLTTTDRFHDIEEKLERTTLV
ncbi:hypothetical protein I4U23_012804 [Adineta vaga]|nr:hypothetical protein I4U23_012804 [Adineta vaga]